MRSVWHPHCNAPAELLSRGTAQCSTSHGHSDELVKTSASCSAQQYPCLQAHDRCNCADASLENDPSSWFPAHAAGVDPAALAKSVRGNAGWGSPVFRTIAWRKFELVNDLLSQVRVHILMSSRGRAQAHNPRIVSVSACWRCNSSVRGDCWSACSTYRRGGRHSLCVLFGANFSVCYCRGLPTRTACCCRASRSSAQTWTSPSSGIL